MANLSVGGNVHPSVPGQRIQISSDSVAQWGRVARRGVVLGVTTAGSQPTVEMRYGFTFSRNDLWSMAWDCGDAQSLWAIPWGGPNPIAFPGYPPECRYAAGIPELFGSWASWSEVGIGFESPGYMGDRTITTTRLSADGDDDGATLVTALEPIVRNSSVFVYTWSGEVFEKVGALGPMGQATAEAEWVFAGDEWEYDEVTDESIIVGERWELWFNQLTFGGGYSVAAPPLVTFTGAPGVVAVTWVSPPLNSAIVDIIDAPALILPPGGMPPQITVTIAAPPAAGDHTDTPPPGVSVGQEVTTGGRTHVLRRTPDGWGLEPLMGPTFISAFQAFTDIFVWGELYDNLIAFYQTSPEPPEDGGDWVFESLEQYDMPQWQYLERYFITEEEAAVFPGAKQDDRGYWYVTIIRETPPRAAWRKTGQEWRVHVPKACWHRPMYGNAAWGDGSLPEHWSIFPFFVNPVAVPYDNSPCYISPPPITPGTVCVGRWESSVPGAMGGAVAQATLRFPWRPISPPWAMPVAGDGTRVLWPKTL
jgi:hypothetical protein